MLAVGVTPIGVSPKPPKLDALAQAYGLDYTYLTHINDLADVLLKAASHKGPVLIEINEQQMTTQLEAITPV